ncbi:ABC transporter permease [Clostridium sp. DL1XJH146]
MKLPFKIAIRFLKSSKGQTVLIALGIAIGVSVQIFIGALIQGLQKGLVDTTIGNSSQITVTSDDEDYSYIENYNDILDTIKKSDDRITSVNAAVDLSAFLKIDEKTNPILVRGFNFDDADGIYNIKERLVSGNEPSNSTEAIVGIDLQEELELSIGDSIEVITPDGNVTELTISGFYDLKVAAINKSWVMVNLNTAQGIADLTDSQVTSIEMQVNDDDVFSADKIALNVSDALEKKDTNSTFSVQNWKAQNEELLSGLNGQSVSSIMIQVFVLVSVVLGIASVLAISVVQKSKQIGILKAMGIKNRTSSQIFLFQGLILGIMGAILGIAFGLLLLFLFTKFAVNPDGTPVVDVYISSNFIILSGFIAILSASLASLIPARSSSKLDPMEVIKNG